MTRGEAFQRAEAEWPSYLGYLQRNNPLLTDDQIAHIKNAFLIGYWTAVRSALEQAT